MYNLNDFIPAKPTPEGVQAISEMFEASVNGELYDPAKWGNFYKPYGLDTGTSTQSTVASAQPAPAVSEPATESVAPVSAPAPAEAKVEAEPVAEAPSKDNVNIVSPIFKVVFP